MRNSLLGLVGVIQKRPKQSSGLSVYSLCAICPGATKADVLRTKMVHLSLFTNHTRSTLKKLSGSAKTKVSGGKQLRTAR